MKSFLKSLLGRFGYRISQTQNTEFFRFESLLYYQLERTADFRFVQIGACDGVSFDPTYEFVRRNHRRIRGVVVEPLPDLFAELRRTYSALPNIVPVNCAIHNSETQMTLYRVDPRRLASAPDWAKGIASFDPEHHRRLGIPSDLMVAESVPCRTLESLLGEHGLTRIDLLQIDTEGYDAQIVLGLDFSRIVPVIIRFEYGRHVGTMSEALFDEVVDRLHRHGYELAFVAPDVIAYRRDIVWAPVVDG